MKKTKKTGAKTAQKAAKKTRTTEAKKASDKKVAAKPTKAAKASAPKAIKKKSDAKTAAPSVAPQKSVKKAKKALESAIPEQKVETGPTTLKEALSAQIKKAKDLEPEAIFAEPVIEKSEQEKKSLLRKLTQAGTNWESVYKIAKGMKTRPYKMSEDFEAKTPIMHKVLGWGFVLSSENNRIQVLFKDGIKVLITNYQGR